MWVPLVPLIAALVVGLAWWAGGCSSGQSPNGSQSSVSSTNAPSAQLHCNGLTSGTPVIFYSDLDSGPNAGGENGQGVYVTIYGKRFGATQGSSTVQLGNTAAINYKVWTDCKVAFQVPSSTPAGVQNIRLTVNGTISNSVPFTVRTLGAIYCVSTSGSDTKSGSFAAGCWKTVQHAVDTMVAGDTTYVRNGVLEARPDDHGSVQFGTNIWHNGKAGNPVALGGYPGETATIGASGSSFSCSTTTCIEGLRAVGVSGLQFNYFTIFNLTLRGQTYAFDVDGGDPPFSSNWRVIGNDLSCPWMNSSSGPYCATFAQTSNVWFYGNNVHDVQTYPWPQAPGPEWNGGVYFTTDSNHVWAAWNTISNVGGARCIQFHSSPLGNGGASDPTGHDQFDLHVHDNLIHDCAMDGILLATVDPSQGPVEVYNNVVYDTGKGPGNGSGYFTGIYVAGATNAGPTGSGTVDIYNNTLYSDGQYVLTRGPGWGGALANNAAQYGGPNLRMQIRNNLVSQPIPGEIFWTMYSAAGNCSNTCNNIFGTNNLFFGPGALTGNPNITASLSVDPMFVNASGGDFHLQAGSPAASAGTATPDRMDFDGIPLPQGASYPVGAYAGAPSR